MAPLAPQMCPQGPWAALLLLVGVLASDTPPSARGRKKVVHVLGECWGGSVVGERVPLRSLWGVGFNINGSTAGLSRGLQSSPKGGILPQSCSCPTLSRATALPHRISTPSDSAMGQLWGRGPL